MRRSVIGFVIVVAFAFIPVAVFAAPDAQAEQEWERAYPLLQQRQISTALPLLFDAAKRGHPRAQATLGNLYHQGIGVPQDDTKAMQWYALAAAQGHAVAEYSLGNGYMLGIGGLPVDQVKATALFEASAQQGFDDAQQAVAMSYEMGRGIPRDRQKAIYWLNQAAAQGDDASAGMAKILRNPHTPIFANEDQLQGFVNSVMMYCGFGRVPQRRPDLEAQNPGYEVWEHTAPNYRDTYCN